MKWFVLDIVLENGKDIPCSQNFGRCNAKFDDHPAEKNIRRSLINKRCDLTEEIQFSQTASIQHSHSIEVNGGPMEKAICFFFPFQQDLGQSELNMTAAEPFLTVPRHCPYACFCKISGQPDIFALCTGCWNIFLSNFTQITQRKLSAAEPFFNCTWRLYICMFL